jgi:hypothetical protein
MFFGYIILQSSFSISCQRCDHQLCKSSLRQAILKQQKFLGSGFLMILVHVQRNTEDNAKSWEFFVQLVAQLFVTLPDPQSDFKDLIQVLPAFQNSPTIAAWLF